MGTEHIQNKAEEWKGAAKEKFGDAIGNEELQGEGADEKARAKAKQVAEDIKQDVTDRDEGRSAFG